MSNVIAMKKYLLFPRGAKIHACETLEILALVKSDLRDRGVGHFSEMEVEAPLHLDYGGCLICGTEPISVKITDAQCISFFAHHYNHVRDSLNAANKRVCYYKIHAERAICVQVETFLAFKKYCCDNEVFLLQQQADAIEALTVRLASIKSQKAN